MKKLIHYCIGSLVSHLIYITKMNNEFCYSCFNEITEFDLKNNSDVLSCNHINKICHRCLVSSYNNKIICCSICNIPFKDISLLANYVLYDPIKNTCLYINESSDDSDEDNKSIEEYDDNPIEESSDDSG